MKFREDEIVESILVGLLLGCIFLLFFVTFGCCSAKCQKEIYVPVEVEVPVPVEGPELPLPEPVDCSWLDASTGDGVEWRNAAEGLKRCLDAILLKMEEYIHVIESYNEAR